MSQFDQTTEKKADEFSPNRATSARANSEHFGFIQGRNSTKWSMEILARAMQEYLNFKDDYTAGRAPHGYLICVKYRETLENNMREAIAQVKANGDWPLEET